MTYGGISSVFFGTKDGTSENLWFYDIFKVAKDGTSENNVW